MLNTEHNNAWYMAIAKFSRSDLHYCLLQIALMHGNIIPENQ